MTIRDRFALAASAWVSAGLLAAAAASAATPVVYYSPGDDGLPSPAPPATISGGSGIQVPIYLDGGATASNGEPCHSGDGDEVCAWNVSVDATGGVALSSFLPVGDVVYDLQPTSLVMNGGDFMTGTLGPTKLGDLYFDSVTAGSLTVGSTQAVSADLQLLTVAPGVLVEVPEPGRGAALASGVMALAALGRRRRSVPVS